MVKKIVNFNMEESKIEQLKERAYQEKKTMTDIILADLRAASETEFYKSQVHDLKNQIKELESKTGKKIPTHKRISIPFTRDEYNAISDAAHNQKLSKPQFLKAHLIHKIRTPMLT